MNTLHREPEPEGECIFRIDQVTAVDDCLVWSFAVDRGRCKGSQVKHRIPLDQKHLWKIYVLLEALGITVPKGPFDFNPDEYVGLKVGGTVSDGRIVNFWPVEKDAAATEFLDRTQGAIDKARADLDDAVERYVRARVAECEDIERQRWRARSMAR